MSEKFTTELNPRAGRRWLQRFVRRLVSILLGEHNAVNLYKENSATKQLEAYAKQCGATVITCDSPAWDKHLLNWMVDPLAYPKQKQREGKQNEVSLRNSLRFKCERGDHASAADNCESVPPMIHLKVGERITHIVVMPPNDLKLSHRSQQNDKSNL